MQYRKISLFLALKTSVYSVQTTVKSDTTDKLSLHSALVELAAGLLLFFILSAEERMLLQAGLTTASELLLPPFSAGRCRWSSAGCTHSDVCRQ